MQADGPECSRNIPEYTCLAERFRSYLENERNTWNGRAIAMSRSKRKNGQITVKVGPEGMPQAVLKLRAE